MVEAEALNGSMRRVRPSTERTGAPGSPSWRISRPDSTDPDVVAAYVLGKWRQPASEVSALVGAAADEAERLVLG